MNNNEEQGMEVSKNQEFVPYVIPLPPKPPKPPNPIIGLKRYCIPPQ
jgi:hypothetical protein